MASHIFNTHQRVSNTIQQTSLFVVLVFSLGCSTLTPEETTSEADTSSAGPTCNENVLDVLRDTAWGKADHGFQRFQFDAMAPSEDALSDGSYATSHFTLDFEEDGFDFAYFIECQFEDETYALVIADYYSVGDPASNVAPEKIIYHYLSFRIQIEDEQECLLLNDPPWYQTKQQRDNNFSTIMRNCWPRDI